MEPARVVLACLDSLKSLASANSWKKSTVNCWSRRIGFRRWIEKRVMKCAQRQKQCFNNWKISQNKFNLLYDGSQSNRLGYGLPPYLSRTFYPGVGSVGGAVFLVFAGGDVLDGVECSQRPVFHRKNVGSRIPVPRYVAGTQGCFLYSTAALIV